MSRQISHSVYVTADTPEIRQTFLTAISVASTPLGYSWDGNACFSEQQPYSDAFDENHFYLLIDGIDRTGITSVSVTTRSNEVTWS